MTLKILTTAALLALTPVLAAAQCSHGLEQQAMSCAEGSEYDAESNSCKVLSS